MTRNVITNPQAQAALADAIAGSDVQTLFAIPHFNDKSGDAALTEIRYLYECLESLAAQRDDQGHPETRFAVVVTDDASPAYKTNPELRFVYERVINEFAGKLKIIAIEADVNGGIGNARNPVIDLAHELQIPTVSFLDHDDKSDAERVFQTIKAFESDPAVTLVYSAFYPIDTTGNRLGNEYLEPGVRKYLENIIATRPEGSDMWKQLFKEIDYINKPSETTVSTELMYRHQFTKPICEDNACWPILMAYPGKVAFIDTLGGYRVLEGQSTNSRMDMNRYFDVAFVSSDLAGLDGAVKVALARGSVTQDELTEILGAHLDRAITLNKTKPGDTQRLDIAAALDDLRKGTLSFDDALDPVGLLARVNYHARRLGLPETQMNARVQKELKLEADGVPVTYQLIGGTGLKFGDAELETGYIAYERMLAGVTEELEQAGSASSVSEPNGGHVSAVPVDIIPRGGRALGDDFVREIAPSLNPETGPVRGVDE